MKFFKQILYFFISVLMLMLLSSCGARGSHAWFQSAEMPDKILYVKEICKGYGYSDRTPGMTECIATEMRDRKRAANQSLDNIGRSLGEIGNSYGSRVTCQNYGSITNCRQY